MFVERIAMSDKKKAQMSEPTAPIEVVAGYEKKKPAQKKVRKKASGSRTASSPKAASAKEKLEQKQNERNRTTSVVLFASGVLMAAMALIPGTSGWHSIHRAFLGIFGVSVFIVPVILIYTSILISKNKTEEDISGRAAWAVALPFVVSAAIEIFFVGKLPGLGFFKNIPELYKEGVALKGGGVISYLIGGTLLKIFGGLGAKIFTLVVFFVIILLLTGKGINEFLDILFRPFTFLMQCVAGVKEMLVDGNFDSGFYGVVGGDDEEDDADGEETEDEVIQTGISYPDREEIEAISLLNGNMSMSQPVRKPEKPAVRRGIPDENGFVMDVPLPGESEIAYDDPLDVPIFIDNPDLGDELPPADPVDHSLDALINKAAENLPEKTEAASAEAVEEETPSAPVKDKTPLYILPGIDLLTPPDIRSNSSDAVKEMHDKAETIVNTFKSFGVEVKISNICRGPSITRYELQPGAGVKVSKIRGLEDDIALSLAAQGVRIEAPIPGKPAVGIEVPNINKDTVTLREILESNEFRNSASKLTFAVGKDITGNAIVGDITKMPHVIIAGTTGSGKSVCTRSIIMSILYNAKPEEVKLILIDPKMVEFKVFEGIPHLLIPIVIDPKKAAGALNWAVNEMMRRYSTFADVGANDLKSYNELAEMDDELQPMAQIVVFIDELADMMLVAGKEVEDSICRLAQMGRAAGMHLVVATQRPTTDVITGLIKANIPSRIALSVMSQVDSRTIIDMAGADKLLGNGDMLYMPIGMNKPVRVQGCFASSKDISATLNFIRAQSQVEYDAAITEAVDSFVPQSKGNDRDDSDTPAVATDEDYVERAIELAVNNGQLSTTMLQKKLKLGYARASRIMDDLEEMGVIGPSEGSKPRKVYMSKMQFDERRMRMEN